MPCSMALLTLPPPPPRAASWRAAICEEGAGAGRGAAGGAGMCGRTARAPAAGASASRAPPLHGDAAPLCHVRLHVTSQAAPPCLHRLMHPVYSQEYLESVAPQHKPPKKVGARNAALLGWQSARPGMSSGSLPARVVGCPRTTMSVLLAPAFFGCPPTKLMSAAVPPSVPPRPPTL